MQKVTLSIEGMTCSACSNGLEKYLNRQKGIKKASVNLVMATAMIEYDDALTIEDLAKFISEAGFKSLGEADLSKENHNSSVIPYIVFGILALLLMYISMAPMLNLPTIFFLDMKSYPINYSLSLLFLTIIFLIFGFDIVKSGIKNLIHKMPNMDTLVSIGFISSFIYSVFGIIMIIYGNHEYLHKLYFESCAFVIYFIKLGRFIEKKSHEKTKDAISKLVTITPKVAKLKTKEGYKEVTIDEVKKGDLLVCFPGDSLAVDGIIQKGSTHTDESFITGESKPVSKKVNDKVIAGSINYDGVIEYKAEKIGKDSTISEIGNLVVEATNTKAPISLLADKICSYFVPVIIIISIVTLLINLLLGVTFNDSLTRFVTVLVVACPCALGLATPLAVVVSEGVCASRGILVKSSETLEMMTKIDTIVFDKTGTLTKGNLSVFKINNYSKLTDQELLQLLGSLEVSSTHPIATSIINYLQDHNISIVDDMQIQNMAGYGIKGTKNKQDYYACNSKYLNKLKINNKYLADEEDLTSSSCSVIYIVKNKTILGMVGVNDTIRDNAKPLIKDLKKHNIEVIMLTGDNQNTANNIGAYLGITNIIADVVPKEKANIIKNLKKENKMVAMVGDGINDAPSLTLADVGISLSSATDIATSSSDVILINNDIYKIRDLFIISKKTLRNIKQNLFWAFVYNLCMIPIATGIFSKINLNINPMIACLAMILSSLLVISNALRLKRIKL